MLHGALNANMEERMVKAGMKAEELEQMRTTWREFMRREDATLIMTQGEVLIRKE